MFSFSAPSKSGLQITSFPTTYTLVFSLLVSQVSAQGYYDDDYYYRSRRNRVIGGVIGAIGLLFILLGVCLIAKRRRNTRIVAYSVPQGTGRPAANANPYVASAPPYSQTGATYDATAPPPPYSGAKGVEANPVGAQTANQTNATSFAPPSGPPPPPQAHIAQ